MGCDIHVFVETLGSGGEWKAIGPPADSHPDHPYRYSHWKGREGDGDLFEREDAEPPMMRSWFWARDYPLFARLADVRNYPEWDIEPMFAPRGVPGDVSPEIAREMKDPDYHSHSWVTLAELDKHFAPDRRFESWRDFVEEIRPLDPNSERIRVVFAFDN